MKELARVCPCSLTAERLPYMRGNRSLINRCQLGSRRTVLVSGQGLNREPSHKTHCERKLLEMPAVTQAMAGTSARDV